MNILKIALRSLQHRGLGSLLTIFSMGLGVMLVVAVLTMHGVVSQQFKSNSSFGYDIIMGASGSSLQVTMNTVFYLSSPVENIPYEYYLAMLPQDQRERELKQSLSYQSLLSRNEAIELASQVALASSPFGGSLQLSSLGTQANADQRHIDRMGLNTSGKFEYLVDMAIPVNLGDYLGRFRVVGTKPNFFGQLYLDIDTKEKLEFDQGRPFEEFSKENGYFEAVLGGEVARELDLTVGDVINPIHGAPESSSAHEHEQGFVVVGVLKRSGTPHDRAAFVNLEGFYLIEDHMKPVDEGSLVDALPEPSGIHASRTAASATPLANPKGASGEQRAFRNVAWEPTQADSASELNAHLSRVPLPIEQREVTAVLVRSYEPDPDEVVDEFDEGGGVGAAGFLLTSAIDEGSLKTTLGWSDFRPARAKEEVQAVSPVREVTGLFETFVNPVRWVLLILTVMICLVSGISILVGIYNSMSQRRHEIAVMRALGASRGKVMSITMLESLTLALAGGLVGWVAGHGLNAVASPWVEAQTGVRIGFWDFAPKVPLLGFLGSVSNVGDNVVEWLQVSPEFFLIPGLVVLAVLVGIYPAISAYRTDVGESLSSQ